MEIKDFVKCHGKEFYTIEQKSVVKVRVVATRYGSPSFEDGEPYLEAEVMPLNNPHYTFCTHPNRLFESEEEAGKMLEEKLQFCSMYDQVNAAHHIANAGFALQGYKDKECEDIVKLLHDIMKRVNKLKTYGSKEIK